MTICRFATEFIHYYCHCLLGYSIFAFPTSYEPLRVQHILHTYFICIFICLLFGFDVLRNQLLAYLSLPLLAMKLPSFTLHIKIKADRIARDTYERRRPTMNIFLVVNIIPDGRTFSWHDKIWFRQRKMILFSSFSIGHWTHNQLDPAEEKINYGRAGQSPKCSRSK